MTTTYINHDALNKIASSLSDAGAQLDNASNTSPSSVDGGIGTALILAIMARLTDNAGQLVVGVKAVGDAITTANDNYRGRDEEMADSLEKTMEKE